MFLRNKFYGCLFEKQILKNPDIFVRTVSQKYKHYFKVKFETIKKPELVN